MILLSDPFSQQVGFQPSHIDAFQNGGGAPFDLEFCEYILHWSNRQLVASIDLGHFFVDLD